MSGGAIVIAYAAFHLVCAFVSYGLMLAHFQRSYPTIATEDRMSDVACSAFVAVLFGPMSTIAAIIFLLQEGSKHGFLLWPRKSQ